MVHKHGNSWCMANHSVGPDATRYARFEGGWCDNCRTAWCFIPADGMCLQCRTVYLRPATITVEPHDLGE